MLWWTAIAVGIDGGAIQAHQAVPPNPPHTCILFDHTSFVDFLLRGAWLHSVPEKRDLQLLLAI